MSLHRKAFNSSSTLFREASESLDSRFRLSTHLLDILFANISLYNPERSDGGIYMMVVDFIISYERINFNAYNADYFGDFGQRYKQMRSIDWGHESNDQIICALLSLNEYTLDSFITNVEGLVIDHEFLTRMIDISNTVDENINRDFLESLIGG